MMGANSPGLVRESAKWTAILIVPMIIVLLVVFGMLGGIEGDGYLVLHPALAPALYVVRLLAERGQVVADVAALLAEVLYFFLIVVLFRLLQLHRLCGRLGKGLAALFRARTEP